MRIERPLNGVAAVSARRAVHESSIYQADTLCLFTVFSALRANWAGRLILSCGLGPRGTNLALAANVAGAACLSIDRSSEACRAALRRGAVDFVVNSLDEALRALKNEIRKGQPLSVALEGDLGHELAQSRERGLLPEVFTGSLSDSSSDIAESERVAIEQTAASLESVGTLLVDFDGTLAASPNALHGWDRLTSFTAENEWELENFDFDSLAALRGFDARVLNLLSLGDPRRRWAIAASRYFQRSRPSPNGSLQRYVYFTADEKHFLTR